MSPNDEEKTESGHGRGEEIRQEHSAQTVHTEAENRLTRGVASGYSPDRDCPENFPRTW
jgi:hypothetical protein